MSLTAVRHRRLLVVVPVLLVSVFAWWASRDGSEALPAPARAADSQAGRIAFDALPGGVTATLPVRSFQAGGANTGTAGGAGSGTGKFVADDPSVVLDAAEVDPLLLRAVATGVHLRSATVTLFRPGTTKRQEVWTLADAIISQLRTTQSGSAKPPRVTLGLRYSRVTVTSYAPNGEVAGSFCFDVGGSTSC